MPASSTACWKEHLDINKSKTLHFLLVGSYQTIFDNLFDTTTTTTTIYSILIKYCGYLFKMPWKHHLLSDFTAIG